MDRFPAEANDQLDLEKVLFVRDGEQVLIGKPLVEGAKVAATVVGQVKGPKVVVFKYKPSVRYRVKTGHRQKYTKLHIDSIEVKSDSE